MSKSKEKQYSVKDFIYWMEKYNYNDLDSKIWTQGQIASIIAKAMQNFFEDSETPY